MYLLNVMKVQKNEYKNLKSSALLTVLFAIKYDNSREYLESHSTGHPSNMLD